METGAVVVKEMGELVRLLELNEEQKMKLRVLSLQVQIENKQAVIDMKPEQFHSIDIAPVSAGNARLTLPVEVTKNYGSRRTSFNVYTIMDKKEILAFFLSGKFDNLDEPVLVMVPKRSEERR